MHSVTRIVAAIAFAGALSQADAATVTANLHVQATLTKGCSVVGGTLDFGQGQYNTLVGHPRSTTNIHVQCTKKADFEVGINDGSQPTGGQRRMVGETPGDFLAYELFKASTGTSRFGDAIVTERVSGTGQGNTPIVIPVFGELLTGQTGLPAGIYADDAVITVYF